MMARIARQIVDAMTTIIEKNTMIGITTTDDDKNVNMNVNVTMLGIGMTIIATHISHTTNNMTDVLTPSHQVLVGTKRRRRGMG